MILSFLQLLLLATLPLAVMAVVVASTVVGVTATDTVPPTCFALFTPSAFGTATKPTDTAQTAQALISFLMVGTSPFLAFDSSLIPAMRVPRGIRVKNGDMDDCSGLAELPGALQRLGAAGDLARKGLGPELLQQPAHLGPRRETELIRKLVARERRARRPLAVPGEGVGQHLAGEVEVRAHHLLARQRALAPRRKPVGHGEKGDVGRHGFRGDEIVIDGPARQRPLVDQESEAQVMQGEALKVTTERTAGAPAPADRRDQPSPDLVVPDEGDVARSLGTSLRLAEVVEERAESQSIPASELVRERLVEELLDVRSQVPGEILEVRLDPEPFLEHCERVAEDVEVVIRVLDDSPEILELRQDHREQGELLQQADTGQRVAPGEDPAHFGELPLAGGIGRVREMRPSQLDRPGVQRQPQAYGQTSGPQQAKRVLLERAG